MHETIVFLCYVWDVIVFREKPSRSVRKLCWVCKSHAVTNSKTFEISKSFNQNFFSGDEKWNEIITDWETPDILIFIIFPEKKIRDFLPRCLTYMWTEPKYLSIFIPNFFRTYKLVNINIEGRSVSAVKRNRNVIQ